MHLTLRKLGDLQRVDGGSTGRWTQKTSTRAAIMMLYLYLPRCYETNDGFHCIFKLALFWATLFQLLLLLLIGWPSNGRDQQDSFSSSQHRLALATTQSRVAVDDRHGAEDHK